MWTVLQCIKKLPVLCVFCTCSHIMYSLDARYSFIITSHSESSRHGDRCDDAVESQVNVEGRWQNNGGKVQGPL